MIKNQLVKLEVSKEIILILTNKPVMISLLNTFKKNQQLYLIWAVTFSQGKKVDISYISIF